jgi:hypothetical protein
MTELTKEILLARRRSLEADALAINGAIQQLDWTLEKLEEGVGSQEPASDSA